METETRSAPDLSLLRVAFLLATMKGTSVLASEDDTKKRATSIEISGMLCVFAIDFARGGAGDSCEEKFDSDLV